MCTKGRRRLSLAGMVLAAALLLGRGPAVAAEEPDPQQEAVAGSGSGPGESMAQPQAHPGRPQACCRVRESELELRWNAAIGSATYEENDTLYTLSSSGLMLEIHSEIDTAWNLDVGWAVGFILLPSAGSFTVNYEGPPASTRNWEVTAVSTGTYLLAKYEYVWDLAPVEIGLENGIGLGYFINSATYEWEDAQDSNITGSGTDDEQHWAPVLRVGLKAGVEVTEVSAIGLHLGLNLIPCSAGGYFNYLITSVGLHYQIEY
ncbi:hypothetical protein JW933_07770 [candidate division FCPU426 bacterium]|nr:hypothetical protein [candidate division FCPU426 bacterium]